MKGRYMLRLTNLIRYMANNTTLKDRSEKNGNNNMRTLQGTAGPKQSTLKNILSYSKALKYEHSEQLGRIGTVLN